VFAQLELTWVFPVLFAAPFWIGMYWRRATTTAAWTTVAFCALMFFVIPFFAPRIVPALRTHPAFTTVNQIERVMIRRPAAPADVARREATRQYWSERREAIERIEDASARQTALEQLGPQPQPLTVGEEFETVTDSGGQAVFWTGGVKPVDDQGNPRAEARPRIIRRETTEEGVREVLAYEEDVQLKGFGNFKLDFLLYKVLGMDLTTKSNAMLSTLELPPKIISPFLVMILISLVTRPNSKQGLDRYYAKMKTPVDPDHARDEKNLEKAYADPEALEQKKLFPGTSLEFQRPTTTDIVGVVVCFLVCFAIIGLAMLVARIGR
jgi:SSS family solute:Na+ symporter